MHQPWTRSGYGVRGTGANCEFRNLYLYTGGRAIFAPYSTAAGGTFSTNFYNVVGSSKNENVFEVMGGPGMSWHQCYAQSVPTGSAWNSGTSYKWGQQVTHAPPWAGGSSYGYGNVVSVVVGSVTYYYLCVETPASTASPTATAWNSATSYVVGNTVSRTGITYKCIASNTNQPPPNPTYWVPIWMPIPLPPQFTCVYGNSNVAPLGPVWNGATAYTVGNTVTVDGALYYCKAANTGKQPGIAADWGDFWQMYWSNYTKAGWRVYGGCNFFGCNGLNSGPVWGRFGFDPTMPDNVPQAWRPSTPYARGERVLSDSGTRVYYCNVAGTSAASGGPNGTGSAITDGTVTWRYVTIGSGETFSSSWAAARGKFFGCNFEMPSLDCIQTDLTVDSSLYFASCYFLPLAGYNAAINVGYSASNGGLVLENCLFLPDVGRCASGAANWQPRTVYGLGDYVNANGSTYICRRAGLSATSGGPATTSTRPSIADGNAGSQILWDYLGTPAPVRVRQSDVYSRYGIVYSSVRDSSGMGRRPYYDFAGTLTPLNYDTGESHGFLNLTASGIPLGTVSCSWTRSGDLVTLRLGGKSAAEGGQTTITLTGLPTSLYPAIDQSMPCMVQDNGNYQFGIAIVKAGGAAPGSSPGSIQFASNASGSLFSGSGTGGIPIVNTLTYSLL